MTKRRLVVEGGDAPLVEVDQEAFHPAEAGNLDNGLLGSQISPGFRKIVLGCPLPNGGVNLVIHGGGNGAHQHWQKFCNEDRTMGYWQNVTGQALQHRKANPIAKLVEEQ